MVEIDPAEGFAPLKNAPGAAEDTPELVQPSMTAQHRRWLRQAGAEVAEDVPVEICPLWRWMPRKLPGRSSRGCTSRGRGILPTIDVSCHNAGDRATTREKQR